MLLTVAKEMRDTMVKADSGENMWCFVHDAESMSQTSFVQWWPMRAPTEQMVRV